MIVNIKMSKRVRLRNRECYGLTSIRGKNRVDIFISETACKDISKFSLTLFHEMLHVWIAVLKSNGATIDTRKSHKFIYAMERALIRTAKLLQRSAG